MPSSAITICTLRTEFLVAPEHPAPERMRAEVDAALKARLQHALSSVLLESQPDVDPSVWLVRRLEVQADVDAASEADQMARTVAGAIASSLGREMTGSGDGINVLHFESRALYLARYLCDRAEGHSGQWYYRKFEGLRMLPTSAALRTAVEREPSVGLEALRSLDAVSQRRVLASFSCGDAARVTGAFRALPPAEDFLGCLTAVAAAHGRGLPHAETALNVLQCVIAASSFERCGEPLVRAAEIFIRHVEGIEPISPDLRRACEIAMTLTAATEQRAVLGSQLRSTRFGGVFFLLSELESVSVDDFPHMSSTDEDVAVLDHLRFAVLALCLSPEAPAAVLGDSALRKLFRIPAGFDATPLIAAAPPDTLATLHAAAQGILEAFSAHLPGFTASRPAYLRKNFLDVSATVEWEPSRIVVRVGKPPLHVLLALAGLMRRRYALPWLSELPIEVFPEE